MLWTLRSSLSWRAAFWWLPGRCYRWCQANHLSSCTPAGNMATVKEERQSKDMRRSPNAALFHSKHILAAECTNRGFQVGTFLYWGWKTVYKHCWSMYFIASLSLLTCGCMKKVFFQFIALLTKSYSTEFVYSSFHPFGDLVLCLYMMLLLWLLWCKTNTDFIWVTWLIFFCFRHIGMCIAGTAVSAGKLRPQLPPSTLLGDTGYKM